MDLIELLNKPFKGTYTYKANFNKIAHFLYNKGYRYTSEEELAEFLEENGTVCLVEENFIDELNMPENCIQYNCILDLIMNELNCQEVEIRKIMPFDACIQENSMVVECEDDMQLEYIEWWCNYFNLKYSKDGYSVLLEDFYDENYITFYFVYENGTMTYSCAIDMYAENQELYDGIIAPIAKKDKENYFFKIDNSVKTKTYQLIECLMNKITDTKEVLF